MKGEFRSLLNKSPHALVALRVGLGGAALVVAFARVDPTGLVLTGLVIAGVLSDVFDGVLARRLSVSSDALRVWDSRADVVFFVSLVVALLVRNPGLAVPVGLFFAVVAVLELSVHSISYVRFKRQSSTHHYLSKAFSVLLFGLVVQFFLWPEVTWYYWLVLGAAVLSFFEAGLIMLSLNEWACDIRSIFDVENGKVKGR
jgi:CDP-diacylglycerol--glycerol-3-phosphate 3-phosphatidyltransferase